MKQHDQGVGNISRGLENYQRVGNITRELKHFTNSIYLFINKYENESLPMFIVPSRPLKHHLNLPVVVVDINS